MARGDDRSPMKVVFIETVHVKTDAMSFKSVVQNLTGNGNGNGNGKESYSSSCTLLENTKSSPPSSLRRHTTDNLCGGRLEGGGRGGTGEARRIISGGGASSHFVPVLTRESSFKEFERMLTELPPMEELTKFWDEPSENTIKF